MLRTSGELITAGESNLGDSVWCVIRVTIRCVNVLLSVGLAFVELGDNRRLKGLLNDCAGYR